MRDINEPLRIAYAAALSQISVPVYYNTLPSNVTPASYVIFRSITNNDTSTKNSFDTSTTITVEIHTKNSPGNSGLSADRIADEVLQVIYPGQQANLNLSRGQVLSTQVANDVTNDYSISGQFAYVTRIITFRHQIFIDGSAESSNVVISNGAIFRLNYTATGGETSFSNSLINNKNIIDVNRDGLSCSEILTSGTPIGKQCLYQNETISFASELEPNEKIFVLYQLN